jgi:glutamate formiminotransferase/formiminotetrahydrofolate cyclodeaminase
MELSLKSFDIIRAMAETGNPNSVSDAGVGALCARAAVHGALLNVKINAATYSDKRYTARKLQKGKEMLEKAKEMEKKILGIVEKKISKG